MKKDIHPTYYPEAVIKCACGSQYQVGSTVKAVKVELCSNCHPFYTGQQKLVDTARRVEKFEAKKAKQAATAKIRQGQTAKKVALKAKRSTKIAVRKQPVTKKIGTGKRKAKPVKKGGK